MKKQAFAAWTLVMILVVAPVTANATDATEADPRPVAAWISRLTDLIDLLADWTAFDLTEPTAASKCGSEPDPDPPTDPPVDPPAGVGADMDPDG